MGTCRFSNIVATWFKTSELWELEEKKKEQTVVLSRSIGFLGGK